MYKLLPLKLPPGLRDNGTTYQAKDRWNSGNFVRFFNDTIQPIGGWSSWTTSGASMAGVPRAMITYLRQSGSANTPCTVIATTTKLFALVGTVLYDITPAGMATTVSWTLDVYGNYVVAVAHTAANTPSIAYKWDSNTANVATKLLPYDATSTWDKTFALVATPERFLMALGSTDWAAGYVLTTGLPNPRMVAWATQEGGLAEADWTPSATNTAGSFDLSTNGQLVCGKVGRGTTLLWTTVDLWGATYIGGELVYRFDKLGNNCGIISPNAAVVTDTAAYWMGQNGFYRFDGFVQPVPCDVQDYVFGSINRSYVHLIWALENPTYSEITWFYPHAAQTEITRYVTHNYRENHWVYGTLVRTAGVPYIAGVTTGPVMTNGSGTIFTHETGTGRNSEGTPSLTSGPLELEDGDNLVQIQKVIPDDETVGDVNLTIYGAQNPDSSETTYGPYTLTASTSVRVKARQVRLKLTEAVASAWRVGVIRLGVVKSSRR
jgi:hypothetical protein